MNLREYAAQQPQETQQLQEKRQEQPAEDWRKVSALKADIATGLRAAETQPELLQMLISNICGEDSIEAAKAAALPISALPTVGGLDMLIADHEAQIAANKRQRARLQKELEAATKEGEGLREELGQLQRNRDRDNGKALEDVLSFYRQTQRTTSADPGQITTAGELYAKHRGAPVAMALLYGVILDYMTRFGSDWLMVDDMQRYTDLMKLKDDIKAAAGA